MIRSFLPVGQGAFYLEQFACESGTVNVVYDCGSSTDLSIVEAEIRSNFKKDEEIAAVFISHFDSDHINGLPYLLQYCKVNHLFFPVITEENRELILLKELAFPTNVSRFISAFIINPHDVINDLPLGYQPRLHQVLEHPNINKHNGIDTSFVNSGSNALDCTADFRLYGYLEEKWVYIPFNFRESERIERLKTAFKTHFGDDYTVKDLLDRAKTNPTTMLPKIKQAYHDIPGSFNTNSMVLLSASLDDEVSQQLFNYSGFQFLKFYPWCGGCVPSFPSGCLYTGDYDASGVRKWDELHHAYAKFSKYIGCLQIPHHGSRHNYNTELLSLSNCPYYLISAGEKNKYRHPHNMVIKDILLNHKYPIIITEHSGTTVRFVIE